MIHQAIKRVKSIFHTKEQIPLETPQNEEACFLLMYQNLHIGTLRLDNGIWIFYYSDTFKQQNTNKKVKPIVNFPDTTRTYRSEVLWPFFATRIPGLSQPQIQEIVKREHIDMYNTVELLKRFGRETITNPFLLTQSVAL